MSEKMTCMPFGQLMDWVLTEHETKGTVFGVHRSYKADPAGLLCTALFQWAVALPTVMLMLVIASACKNMWVSLGIGVILVFTLSIFPQDHTVLSLCPFSSPYQTLAMAAENGRVPLFLGVCTAETAAFGFIELLYNKIRRYTE